MKKKGLGARYSASYETRDGGGKGKSVMNWKNVQSEITFFKAEVGRNRFDLIPYQITSNHHPLVAKGEMEVGDLDYVMDVWVHTYVGPGKHDVVCLNRNYGKSCPICQLAFKHKNEGDSDAFDQLKAKRKVFYNVRDAKEPAMVKVFEASHYLFEKELIEEARRASDNGEIVDFADPEDGKTIQFYGEEKKFGQITYLEYKSFRFLDREKSIRPAMLEDAVPFDAILNVLKPSEIEAILFDDEDEDIKPAKQDDEEAPARRSPVDEEDDEKPTKKESLSDCPNGFNFGSDCDEKAECVDCNVWDACYKAGK